MIPKSQHSRRFSRQVLSVGRGVGGEWGGGVGLDVGIRGVNRCVDMPYIQNHVLISRYSFSAHQRLETGKFRKNVLERKLNFRIFVVVLSS